MPSPAIFLSALIFTVVTFVVQAHDDDHHDQLPLGYVKFPYQAVYTNPGEEEGD